MLSPSKTRRGSRGTALGLVAFVALALVAGLSVSADVAPSAVAIEASGIESARQAVAAPAQQVRTSFNRVTCERLEGQTMADVEVTDIDWILAGGLRVCVVSGHRAPFLDIEVILPQAWSGRSFQQGGGGFDGRIPSGLVREADGNVTGLHGAVADFKGTYAASNGGNRADVEGEAGPGVWVGTGPDNVRSLLDYNYHSLDTTMHFAEALIEAAYRRPARYAYFNGCSNGGRNAYIVAQRWPDHFDGVVSGCEPMNMPGTTTAWMSVGRLAGTPSAVSNEQYQAVYAAAIEHCDPLDGAADGVIADSFGCDFDPAAVSCASAPGEHCLSDEQLATIRMLTSDIVDADGNVVNSAFTWGDYSRLGPLFGLLGSVYAMIGDGDRSWLEPANHARFDVDEHHYRIGYGLIREGLAHDRIGIASFVVNGGKLIGWHAGDDDLLSARDHLRNFEDMMSSAAVLAEGTGVDPSDGAAFYLVPGAGHGEGIYPSVDWLAAITDWVERDIPASHLTYQFGEGQTIPVCRFPAVALGVGGGEPACVNP